jgi:hypothetical protein
MSYIINKTDGSKLAEVADGTTNSVASGITLIGKNVSGFGETLNENLIKLLENFANVEAPSGNAIPGQLWFDTSLNSLKVYTGTEWRTVGSAALSETQPATLRSGDLWFDTLSKQLYFNTGNELTLVAPAYSSNQGRSGIEVATVKNIVGADQTVLKFYISGILIGIISKIEFTPLSGQSVLEGYTNLIIKTGFNLADFADAINFKFRTTATNADALGNVPADSFVRKDIDSIVSAQLSVTNGVRVGPINAFLNLSSTNGYAAIGNTADDLPLTISVRSSNSGIQNAIYIDPTTQTIILNQSNISSTVAVGGQLVVDGNLTVRGTTTAITTNNLIVKDKLIEINKPEIGVVSDSDANGGGISLKGTTDHTIIWSNSTDSWDFSENVNIASGKAFYINGVQVLNYNTLSSAITSAPGLTSFGTQSTINVGVDNNNQVLRINNNMISTLVSGTDLRLSPYAGSNIALVGTPKITGLGTPTSDQDATTKLYVDELIGSKNFAFSLDITGLTNSGIISILNDIAPVAEFAVGAIARISTTQIVEGQVLVDLNSSLDKSLVVEVTGTDLTNYSVLRDVAFDPNPVVINSGIQSVIRGLKKFEVQTVSQNVKAWVHLSAEDENNITYPRP